MVSTQSISSFAVAGRGLYVAEGLDGMEELRGLAKLGLLITWVFPTDRKAEMARTAQGLGG